MRTIIKILRIVVFTIGVLGGCSAKYEVEEISHLQPGAEITGIPFRTLDTYNIHLYVFDEDKDKYVLIESQETSLPNPDRIYSVGLDAKLLSDHKFEVGLRENGILTGLKLLTENEQLKTATALSTAITKVKGDFDSIEAARRKAELQEETDRNNAAIKLLENQKAAADAILEVEKQDNMLAALQKVEDDLKKQDPPDPVAIAEAHADVLEQGHIAKKAKIDADIALLKAGEKKKYNVEFDF